MAENSTKQTGSPQKQHSSLERVNLSFEYNETWQDARRAFSARTTKASTK